MATRCGCWSQAAPPSPPSRSGTGCSSSGAYLALFLVLLALIARGVSFEFRGKIDDPGWRRAWDVANFVGSLVAALVWGVAFTNFAHGLPLSTAGYTGGLMGLLNPMALVGGLATLAIFAFHGSVFLSLKTSGELMQRAQRAAADGGLAQPSSCSPPRSSGSPRAAGRGATLAGALPGAVPLALALIAVVALAGAALLIGRGRDGCRLRGHGRGRPAGGRRDLRSLM